VWAKGTLSNCMCSLSLKRVYYVCQSDAVCVASSPDLIPAVPLVPGAGEVVEADRFIRCVHAWCYACVGTCEHDHRGGMMSPKLVSLLTAEFPLVLLPSQVCN